MLFFRAQSTKAYPKRQMINTWYQNQRFLGSEFGSESYCPHTCFRRHPGIALSLEEDAIFDLRPEGPSRQAITLVALGESQSLRYADHRVTWNLPDHFWPWALTKTSIFSKNKTKIKYKLNFSRTVMFYFCFQRIKALIMLAVLNWNKSLK